MRAVRHIACGGAAAGLIAALLLGGCERTAGTTSEHACSGAQAISVGDLKGSSLAAKTIALTFDDGPGVRTAELSTYLKAEGIHAAFFVNGKMVGPDVSVLAQIIADGHVIGNHTQTHTSLTGRSTGNLHLDNSATVAELAQTDALISPFVANSRYLFRAPYGDFDAVTASAISASPMNKYVGPINWDIGDRMGPGQAADWDCWSAGSDGLVLSVAHCAALYLKEIDSVGRGAVLLHDPYFIDNDPTKGGTVDMIKLLVPALKTKGYTFARIDEVPAIASLLPPAPAAADAGGSGDASDGGPSGSSRPSSNGSPSRTTVDPTAPAGPSSAEASSARPDPCAPSSPRTNAP